MYTKDIYCLQIMREGKDVSLIGFGKLVGYNLQAAEILEKEGISCEVSVSGGGTLICLWLVANGWVVCSAQNYCPAGAKSADVETD